MLNYDLISLTDASKATGVSKSTIWRAAKNGKIAATKISDGDFRIARDELFKRSSAIPSRG